MTESEPEPEPVFHTLHAARPGRARMTAERLWSIPRVGAPVPSPDGTTLVVPVATFDEQASRMAGRLWLVSADGGDEQPLTGVEHDASAPAFSPDGRHLAFVARPRGEKGETPLPGQLHVLPLEGGEAEVITDAPLGAFDPAWLRDGSGLVFGAWLFAGHLDLEATRSEASRRKEDPPRAHVTEERFFRIWDRWLTDGKVPHLFLWDRASGDLRDLMPESTLWFDWMDPSGAYDVSPDGREIVFSALARLPETGRPRARVYRLRVGEGAPVCLTPDAPAACFRPRYLPNGRDVIYGRTEDPDFYADRVRLWRFVAGKERHAPVLTTWDRSPGAWRFGDDGTLYFHAEDDGRTRLFALPVRHLDDSGTPEPLTDGGTHTGPRPAPGGRVFCSRHTLGEPPEVVRLDRGTTEPTRVTRFTEDAMRDVALGEVRSVGYTGAGGESVQMFVCLPPDAAEGAPHSLVHMIHGGPHGLFADAWHWRWHAQTLAAAGHVVAIVNFQGSTSWGQDFAARIRGAMGERPTEDVLRATDLLVASGLVDERRMAIAGGSYGGYLVTWLASHTDRFACAVNHAGVYDTALQYASDFTFGIRSAQGGTLWDERQALDRWNPARHAEALNTPMLVVHGEKDYRVPVNQGLLCYGVLQAKGVPARLLYFEDENHWVLQRGNSLLWYEEVLGWLDRFLRDPGAAAPTG